jgi:TRAP-type C4-dicarboxylate transport system permease small subunit
MSGSIIDALARANARVTMGLARIAAIALAVIAAVTFGDVVGRYFFHAPFAFTVELTQMAMGLVVYLGVGLVTHEDAHISADVVVLRLPPRLRALLALATNLLALGFLAAMVWRLWLQAEFLRAKGDTTMVWQVPLWPVAVAIAAGSLLLLTGVMLHLIRAWQALANAEGNLCPQRRRSLIANRSAGLPAWIRHCWRFQSWCCCSCCSGRACRSASRWGCRRFSARCC